MLQPFTRSHSFIVALRQFALPTDLDQFCCQPMKKNSPVKAIACAKIQTSQSAVTVWRLSGSSEVLMPMVQHTKQHTIRVLHAGLAGLCTSLLMLVSIGCSSSPTLKTERPQADAPTTVSSPNATITQSRRVNAKPIAHVLTAEPTAVVDTTVQLKGRIVQQVPLIDGHIYELQDETGSIWVVAASDSEALAIGNTIQVEGIVAYENIAIAGQEQGELYIQEQQIFD